MLNVAFKNPDGSLVLIAYNNTNEAQSFKVRWHARVFRYTLPVSTSVTFRWPEAPASAEMHSGSKHEETAISGQGIQ